MPTQETIIEKEPMTEQTDKKERPEFDLGEEFINSGGKVLEWYDDGRPKRWLCGRSPKGEPICPEGMQKDAIIYLNNKGQYEGTNPGQETREDIEKWRSDWQNVR